MEPSLLLQQYRRDRRRLIEFVLSSGLIRAPSGDSVELSSDDLDTVSADYVLDCIKSGGEFDLTEATKKYFYELEFPIMMNAASGNSFFLLSEPELSGSPPRRVAPKVGENLMSNYSSHSTKQADSLAGREIENSKAETSYGNLTAPAVPCGPMKDTDTLSLGLPALTTGMSDDDIRETAYEVLLASAVISGERIRLTGERKKVKKSRFLRGPKSKRDKVTSHSELEDSHSDVMDTIRIQMEISESMDSCTKQSLRHLSARTLHDVADIPQISLELLSTICKSDFLNARVYTQWQKRQANILDELLRDSANFVADERTLYTLVSELRNAEDWVNIGPNGRAEILSSIKGFASKLSRMSGKFGIPGETYYWTSAYHFNVKVYEKLLCCVFDILEDGEIVEDAGEILKILKLTWSTLGITQKMHDALYVWVLFRQFVQTGEVILLNYASLEMRKVLANTCGGGNEEAYVNSLVCSSGSNGSKRTLNLVDAILFSIYAWCSSQLEDYHLHFGQEKYVTFESVLNLAILSGTRFVEECEESKVRHLQHYQIQYIRSTTEVVAASKLVHVFVEKSIGSAYKRVLEFLETRSKKEGKHALVILANELKQITEKESSSFIPVLYRHCPEVGTVSFILLHQLYEEALKPYLKDVTDLSDGAISVLAASYSFDCYLADAFHSICGDGVEFYNYVCPYQINHICSPLVLHWVNAQHDKILQWTKRAIDFEEWEPLSSQQRQAASIIEVFRIIEETIDQFFGLTLPMDIIHLRSLLIGLVRSLDAYLLHMINQQVGKNVLYPSPPPLTRYKESTNPFTKKKFVNCTVLEEEVTNQLNCLTVSKLCVKLNTLHYIRGQLDSLEDSIQQSWLCVPSANHQRKEESPAPSEPVDELFTIFDDIRRTAIDASDVIFDFIGARVIFWDMRDSFLFSLYRDGIENTRLENFVSQLDRVLDHICGLVVDEIRDQVVLSICQASMDGYMWVMLDGGPSRVFSETDVMMMQEDLNILKDLFIANDQGLPRGEVEKEARLAQEILELYALKADTIIEMLIVASEQISFQPDLRKPGSRHAKDADTLLRVLCHKKDKTASKFLKLQYHLSKSSDYEDTPGEEQTSKSPLISGILIRSASFNWTEKGHRSYTVMKKKFQEATSEIRHAPW